MYKMKKGGISTTPPKILPYWVLSALIFYSVAPVAFDIQAS
jgi:hypothetical protein